MVASNLSANLVAPLMYALRVAEQAEKKLGSVLDTTKQWIRSGDNTCNCHLYPSSFPRRHGHIVVPSWEYRRPYKHTVTALMASVVQPHNSPAAFELAVLQCWKRHLPQSLLVRVHTYDSPVHPPTITLSPPSEYRSRRPT